MAEYELLPFDLGYGEPVPRSLDLAFLKTVGKRRRNRRRLTLAAGSAFAFLVVVTVGLQPTLNHGGSVGSSPAAPAVAREFLRENPPAVAGGLSVLDTANSDWKGLAWLDAGGRFCIFRYHVGGVWHECHFSGLADGTRPSISLPIIDTDGVQRVLLGVVRGPATSVQLTRFGQTVSVPLVPLVTSDATREGVYTVPLPAATEHPSFASSDITSFIATDADGRVVARWPEAR
jgi:hypothetical protein